MFNLPSLLPFVGNPTEAFVTVIMMNINREAWKCLCICLVSLYNKEGNVVMGLFVDIKMMTVEHHRCGRMLTNHNV